MRGPFFFLLVLICLFLLIATIFNEASRYSNQSSSQPDNASKTPEASPKTSPNPQEPSNVLSEQASPAPLKKITPDTSRRPGTLAAPPTQPSTIHSTTPPYFKIKDECYIGLQSVVGDSSKLREDIELCTKSEAAFSEYLTQAWSQIPDDRKSYCTQDAQLRDFHGVQYFVIGLCVKEQIDDETLRGKMPPPSDVEEILRIHQIVIRFAHDRGETPQEFAERVHSSLKSIERFVYELEKSGLTTDEAFRMLEGFSEALKDPEKQKLLECMGVKVFEDPQPIGHPPSAAECEQLEQKLGLPPAAENSAPAAPAPAAPAQAPASVPAYVPSTPVLHIPPRAIRERSHPEWKPLAPNSREFREIQESCSTLPAAQVSECWYQEREAYDWSVAQRTKFPKEKYPESNAKRVACWNVAKSGDVLRFTKFKNCVSSN